MLDKKMITKFYEDLESLKLKFPVAALVEATNYSKSSVSKVVSKKLEPSEDFISAFYKSFKNSFNNISHENETKKAETQNSDISALIAQNTTLIESHNRLTRTLEMLVREKTSATVEKQQQFEVAYLARLADVLEVMIDIGTGKKWKSRAEAREALDKFLTDPLVKR